MDTFSADLNRFGTYLRKLRTSRGYSNINEYLRRYPVSISHVHYRHLESGRRNIGIESAKGLCKDLDADAKVFYYYLLEEWVPREIMDFFITLSADPSCSPLEGGAAEQTYQKVRMLALSYNTLYPDEQCCNYLNEHFELMSVVWFIYSVPKATVEDVGELTRRHDISMPVDEILSNFEKHGLIERDEKLRAYRVKPLISFTHHKLGLKILRHETERRLAAYVRSNNPELKNSIAFLSTMSVSAQSRKTMFRRLQGFRKALEEAATDSFRSQLEPSEPVFYSVIFAPRPKYRAQPISD